jgi:hypothetical protein
MIAALSRVLRLPGTRGDAEQGSILIAMLGVLVLTGVATLGISALIGGQKLARHDVAYTQALAAAEAGLDQLAAQIRQDPLHSSFSPINGTDPQTSATYQAAATGSAGHWVVDSKGTATRGTSTVTREVQENVDAGQLLSRPLVGVDSVALKSSGNSGVDNYDSNANSDVCDVNGGQQSMTYSGTRMCHQTSPALGPVTTDGSLTMTGSDINNVSEADIYNAPVVGYTNPDAIGTCVGDATTCNSSKVKTYTDKLDFPVADVCQNGIGAGASAYDGSYALAANAVYNFTDVTLNATAIANLANLSNSQLVICFSGTLTVPSLVPLNSTVANLVPLRLDPRPPSTLVLVSTSNGSNTPVVDLGAGLATETSLSAVIYAPNATCKATGHVDVYGALVCDTVTANAGLDVHYDTQLGSLPFDRPVTISHWHEVH